MPVTIAKRINSWELMTSSLKPFLPELPELAARHAELEAHIRQTVAMQSEQETLRFRLREVTKQRQEAEAKGQDLRLRLAYMLKASLGFSSKQLIAFGLTPRGKSKKATPGDVAPEPTSGDPARIPPGTPPTITAIAPPAQQ